MHHLAEEDVLRLLTKMKSAAKFVVVNKGTGKTDWNFSYPQGKTPFDAMLGSADEVAEVSYAFAAKLLEEQSEFMAKLSKAMAGDES